MANNKTFHWKVWPGWDAEWRAVSENFLVSSCSTCLIKKIPGRFLYVIVQVFTRLGKISGRVWSSRDLYFSETVGQAKIPMARPNKPWYFPESSKNLHDYLFIIPDQKGYFWKQKSLDLRNLIHAWTHARNHIALANFQQHKTHSFDKI